MQDNPKCKAPSTGNIIKTIITRVNCTVYIRDVADFIKERGSNNCHKLAAELLKADDAIPTVI